MKKQPFKIKCNKCGREHYENRSCIKKETNSNNILIKEKNIYK